MLVSVMLALVARSDSAQGYFGPSLPPPVWAPGSNVPACFSQLAPQLVGINCTISDYGGAPMAGEAGTMCITPGPYGHIPACCYFYYDTPTHIAWYCQPLDTPEDISYGHVNRAPDLSQDCYDANGNSWINPCPNQADGTVCHVPVNNSAWPDPNAAPGAPLVGLCFSAPSTNPPIQSSWCCDALTCHVNSLTTTCPPITKPPPPTYPTPTPTPTPMDEMPDYLSWAFAPFALLIFWFIQRRHRSGP